jgi:DNA-binding winged helix-turn-helix (wHTH) protein
MDCPTCPRCHQPIRRERFGIYLPELKGRIVDAIAAAGDIGIGVDDLIATVWGTGGSNRNTVKSHIQQLNELLAGSGVRIRREGCRYQPGHYFITRSKRAVA